MTVRSEANTVLEGTRRESQAFSRREGKPARVKRWSRVSVAAVAVCALSMGALAIDMAVRPSEASAGATGCNVRTSSTTGTYAGITFPIPTGKYCVSLSGYGRYVDYVWTSFAMASNLCYYNVTAEFFDKNWVHYRTINGRVTNGCTPADNANYNRNMFISVKASMRPGWMCSTLKSGGKRVTSVCHAVY